MSIENKWKYVVCRVYGQGKPDYINATDTHEMARKLAEQLSLQSPGCTFGVFVCIDEFQVPLEVKRTQFAV